MGSLFLGLASIAGAQAPADPALRERLTDVQFYVTQQDGTEPPFNNAYWNNEQPGIYLDIVDGTPLFTSRDQFDSGTGWPSFSKPLSPDVVVTVQDPAYGIERQAVRGAKSNAYLGQLVRDISTSTGQRYTINSAALRFVPVEELKNEGLGHLTGVATKAGIAGMSWDRFWEIASILWLCVSVIILIVGFSLFVRGLQNIDDIWHGRRDDARRRLVSGIALVIVSLIMLAASPTVRDFFI